MKLLLLMLCVPDFLRDMPPRQAGVFIAETSSVSPWFRWVRYSKKVNGRRRAYIRARWEALKVDWITSSPECGVTWSVYQPLESKS
jgi:hypothetical protein